MDLSIIKASEKNHTLVVFSAKVSTGKKAKAEVAVKGVPREITDYIRESIAEGSLRGDAKESVLFRDTQLPMARHLLVVGLGDAAKVDHETIRNAAADCFKSLRANRQYVASVQLNSLTPYEDAATAAQALVEGFQLANYNYDDYKTDPKIKQDQFKSLKLVVADKNTSAVKKGIEAASIVAESVTFARWLGDTPGNLMTPERLAKETQKAAQGTKVKVTVWDKARIKKEKMGGLYGVSLGSSVDPRFIIMEYKGAGAGKKPVVFVGKGLTFDSGGISIKPAQGMDEMKYDMCGGANVIATVLAIAKLKLKVNVVGLVPATENMPGPLANKPGDILVARNGKTVEVLNTDAEGRLILMDALSYASELKPAAIFDAATLTGAMVVALSNIYTGFFTRDQKLGDRILGAAKKSGELVWPMPIHDHHVADIKGTHADISNIGNYKGGGSSTAAAFLEQFVDKEIPWAHFDIAGTAWAVGNRLSYCQSKNASGAIIRTFIELARSFS